jgi:hypothetical protein
MSFSDLMSSGRGPGVIGMLLALVVVAGFGILFLFAFDDGMQGADQSIESLIAQQSKDISSLRSSIADSNKRLEVRPALESKAKQLKSETGEIMMRTARIDSLHKSIATTKAAIAANLEGFEKYKDEYRAFARNQAKGEELPSLKTLGGTVYEKVKIREVTAIGMEISHNDGHKRIPYEDLPEDLQDRFQFDTKQKQLAIAAEDSANKKHNEAVAIANAATDATLAAQREQERQTAKANAAKALAAKKSQITSLKEEINQLERNLRIETTKKFSRAPMMREELANKQNQLSTLQSQVSQLEALQNQ